MTRVQTRAAAAAQVWYAAYGSNLAEDRFLCYVRGGRPSGSKVKLQGCRDKTLPVESRGARLPLRPFIAGRSKSWDGHGVAFVGTRWRRDESTHVRIWLVRKSQLEDIVAQENGLQSGAISIDSMELSRDHHWDLRIKGKYPRIIRVGTVDSRPVVTCTTADPSLQRRPNAPASAYLGWMAKGLRELSWTDDEIANYLFGIRGINRTSVNTDAVRAR